jgi:hypothetical protein
VWIVDPLGLWYINNSFRKGVDMDLADRAKRRLEHWIAHNEHHHEEYENFVKELDDAGKPESSGYIREMIALNLRSTECLRNALKALDR